MIACTVVNYTDIGFWFNRKNDHPSGWGSVLRVSVGVAPRWARSVELVESGDE